MWIFSCYYYVVNSAFLSTRKEGFVFLACIFIFFFLIFKDPFSQRTLIPNFEPYPDTFFYINPALNFVKGEGFNMNREGRAVKLRVPPLYSFSLIPVFVINPDPRMSYYTNVFLAFISLFLFFRILKKIFPNRIILYSLLILYITNYYIYWIPSLIMAENLTLTLYLTAIYLLLSNVSGLNSIITAVLAVGIYATKYANVPITITLSFLYVLKILYTRSVFKQKINPLIFFLLFLILCYLILSFFERLTTGNDLFFRIFGNLSLVYHTVYKETVLTNTASSSWFGTVYIKQNLPLLIKSLLGNQNRFLWDYTPLIPNYVGILGLVGIVISIFYKKLRLVAISLLLFLSSLIIFLSTFYTFDARYIFIAIPTLIIGFGFFLMILENKIFFGKKMLLNSLILIFIFFYLTGSFTRIKSQMSLNLRYAETPWYYIAVLKMNEYFTPDKVVNGKKPVLISALPPFFVDYYSNGNYTLLPLSYDQEFRGQSTREIVWGPNDYSNLPKLYKKYLDEGYDVYVSRAGLGNEGYTNRDFNTIVDKFDTELVLSGCFDQCNIYSVRLKSNNERNN